MSERAVEANDEPRFVASRTMESSDRRYVPLVAALVVVLLVAGALISGSSVVEFIAIAATMCFLPFTVQAIAFAGREIYFVEASKNSLLYRRILRATLRIERRDVASVQFVGPERENGPIVSFTKIGGNSCEKKGDNLINHH